MGEEKISDEVAEPVNDENTLFDENDEQVTIDRPKYILFIKKRFFYYVHMLVLTYIYTQLYLDHKRFVLLCTYASTYLYIYTQLYLGQKI